MDSTYTFPDDWEGKWEGTLAIWNGKGKQMELPMRLTIDCKYPSKDSCEWTMHYGADSSDIRNYLLKTVNDSTGHYVIDERNDIVLDNYLIGGKLIAVFKVEATEIVASYQLKSDGIHFEIIIPSHKTINITGENNKEVKKVESFPILGRHYAILKKTALPNK